MGIQLVHLVLMKHGAARKVTCPTECSSRRVIVSNDGTEKKVLPRRAACPDHPPTGLTSRAFKVLLRMAATALDQQNAKGQPPNLYFAGEGPLVAVLYGPEAGGLVAAEESGGLSSEEAKRLKDMRREVRAAVSELCDAGLIVPEIERARIRHRQSFRLVLSLGAEGQVAHPVEGQVAHPVEGQVAHLSGGKLPTPRNTTGATEDLSEDTTPHLPAPSTDRAPEAGEMDDVEIGDQAHDFKPDDSGLSCARCYRPYNLHSSRRAS